MNDRAVNMPSPQARRLPSWAISCAIHLTLFLLLVLLLRDVTPRSAESPGRSAGIVLRHATDDLPRYEGEEDQAPQVETMAERADAASDALLATLSTDLAAAEAASALPAIPTIGPGDLADGHTGDATEMLSGGRGQSGAVDGATRVAVFGAAGRGRKFLYVFDRSVSMEGLPLKAAKHQLLASLDSLESTHQFQIIFFNDRVRIPDLTGGQGRVAFATEQNKVAAQRFVQSIVADGGTDRVPALTRAIGFRPDVIFFLTDADTPMSAVEVQRALRQNRRVGASIVAIEFGFGPAPAGNNFLKVLANSTMGQYVYVSISNLARWTGETP